jgi:hypothetical protein
MTVVQETAARLDERLAPYGEDAVRLAYMTAIAMLFKRSEEALRWDERGSGWRRLLDPSRTPDWFLPWLAMLVGSPKLAGLTPAQQRQVVRDAPTLKRGTPAALMAAARLQMPEGTLVRVIERDGGAYKITVQTHPSETPDPALVESAVRDAKAAGLILTYVLYDGLLVGIFEGLDTWPTIADFEADFTDVDEFESYTLP